MPFLPVPIARVVHLPFLALFFPSRGTAYDVRFHLLGIPVTVSPFFWITAVILGFSWVYAEPGGPVNLVAWVLCVFVSLILHEFGHALTMRAFGHHPEVVLFHFGGYATYNGRETPGRALAISAAGPAAQLVLFAAIVIRIRLWAGLPGPIWEKIKFPPQAWMQFLPQNVLFTPRLADVLAAFGLFGVNTPLYVLVFSMISVNLIWPLFNLLPILPLDGGRILQESLELARVKRAETWALRVGVVVGVLGAVSLLLFLHAFLAGAMLAFMAMSNYQALQGGMRQRWG